MRRRKTMIIVAQGRPSQTIRYFDTWPGTTNSEAEDIHLKPGECSRQKASQRCCLPTPGSSQPTENPQQAGNNQRSRLIIPPASHLDCKPAISSIVNDVGFWRPPCIERKNQSDTGTDQRKRTEQWPAVLTNNRTAFSHQPPAISQQLHATRLPFFRPETISIF